MSTVPASPRLPDGIRLRINSHVRRHDEGRVVVGGSPGRLMRSVSYTHLTLPTIYSV